MNRKLWYPIAYSVLYAIPGLFVAIVLNAFVSLFTGNIIIGYVDTYIPADEDEVNIISFFTLLIFFLIVWGGYRMGKKRAEENGVNKTDVIAYLCILATMIYLYCFYIY
ncbi:MAG: hypothetical protein WC878_01520 [Candidatus Paceibacterota bacterium]|jgi:hypothetical protein